MMERKLNAKEATAYLQSMGLKLGPHYLVYLRFHKEGPVFYKFGGSIFYNKNDLNAWVESFRSAPSA